ncbi:MAG TPA: glycosyltransferase family 1 protein, partial [Telluria sp.]|nr:glycosyltransferase family 1 protein [Telluria sp.]
MRPLKILTWHTHGAYLYYLTQAPHEFYVISKEGRPPGYGGRCGHIPWGANVHDLPAEMARHQEFDCILFQDDHQFEHDQYEYLSASQRALPRIYLEHDPPREHPTGMRHLVDDPDILLVHVTHFNALMWDNGRTPTRVIEHGVLAPPNVAWSGELERGLVAINHLARRGRRMGGDIFSQVRREVPLDLVGMGAEELGGLGEIRHALLPAFAARYRFLFSPVRYS